MTNQTIPAIPGFFGVFRDDDDARAVYSESAGIARILPRAVAVPQSADDVIALVRWANETRTPLIPRGSGSSMSNGSIGDGIIVDLSRMQWIDPVDVQTKRIRVGPGALRGTVDTTARAVGLRFPPDPSSGKFCTIGGMISTNAAGSHTVKFGAMRSWVHALDCVMNDGTRITITRGESPPRSVPAIDRLLAITPRLRELDMEQPIEHPGVYKESSGYDVRDYLERGDLIDLLIGSEGTLAFIVGAELRLTEVPGATSSILAAFSSLEDAVTASAFARSAGVAACELLDRTFIEIVSRRAPVPHVPVGSEAVLLVEVEGNDADDVRAQIEALQRMFHDAGATNVVVASNPVEETDIWELRHAASPTLATLGPSLTSMQFIEDSAVPPANFPAYVRGVRRIFEEFGITGVIFGHAGDAHAHVNPLIDTGSPNWRTVIHDVLDRVVTLTADLQGTLAAEHGDGRLRTPLLERVWPARALEAFRLVKEAFDPNNVLNPGVKVPLPPGKTAEPAIKYDPSLPPLPPKARAALAEVGRERAYHKFRLDLVDQAS